GSACAMGSPSGGSAPNRGPIGADVGRFHDPEESLLTSARQGAAPGHGRSEPSSLVVAGKRGPYGKARSESAGLLEHGLGVRRHGFKPWIVGRALQDGRGGEEAASRRWPGLVRLMTMNPISLQDLQRAPAALLDRVEAGNVSSSPAGA